MAAPIELEALFDKKRLQDKLTVILSVIYFPLGLALVIVRLFMSVHVVLISCLLPRSQFTSFVLKTIYSVIGISVIVEDNEHQNMKTKVLVSNHISTLDHMAIDLIHSNIVPNDIGLPNFLCSIFGYQDFKSTDGVDVLQNNIKKFCQESDIPVLLHPERATTNGKVGLLKFHKYPFDLDLPVQPITIQAVRKPFNIPVSILYSSWFTDFVWCLFVPYTFFKLRYLPVEQKLEGETAEEFAERVQTKISQSLNIPVTEFTHSDKLEYLKKIAIEKAQNQVQNGRARTIRLPEPAVGSESGTRSPCDQEIEQMSSQVRDVLPDIPIHIIKKQLEETRDVDVTIANILEGKIKVTVSPERPQKTNSRIPVLKSQTSPAHHKFAADTFEGSSRNRQMSLMERKQQMMETARQKYKEKHGIL